MPSFSTITKTDVAKIKTKNKCCRQSELTAFVWFCGTIGIGKDGIKLTFTVSVEQIAKRIISLIKNLYNYDCQIRQIQKEQLKKSIKTELVVIGETAGRILIDTGIFVETDNGYAFNDITRFGSEKECCKDAFLRALFLACGTIYPPEKGYHMEFVIDDLERANEVCRIMYDMGWNVHLGHRRDKEIVYIKEFDSISEFLGHIGAFSAYLQLEDARMKREINNDVNRGSNCNNANIIKLVDAAQNQIKAIQFLEREGILRHQSLALRQTAEMRLEYPEASLDELADLLNITKSGVNHRLRKLVSLASENQNIDE